MSEHLYVLVWHGHGFRWSGDNYEEGVRTFEKIVSQALNYERVQLVNTKLKEAVRDSYGKIESQRKQ